MYLRPGKYHLTATDAQGHIVTSSDLDTTLDTPAKP